jgi:hypothetical protein
VCGRRDAVMPRNVQKDPEASLTWTLKDEIMGRGKVYYAKLAPREEHVSRPAHRAALQCRLGSAQGR